MPTPGFDARDSLGQWLEHAPGFVALLRGPEHVVELANRAFHQLVGQREVLGRPVFEALPDIRSQGFEQLLERVVASGEPYVGRGLRLRVQRTPGAPLDEAFVDLIYQPVFGPQGAVTGVFVQGHDVTAHLSAVEALRHSERRLNAVLDNASVAIFLMDERQQCMYMNAAAEQLTGYTLAETRGRPLHDVVHHSYPDGRPYPLQDCPIDRAFPQNNQEQGEEIFVHRDGSFYPVGFTASPIRDESARTVGTIIEVRDIRVEKRALEALREADRRKDEFLAMLAHELRNPLAPLTNVLRLLARSTALGEREQHLVAVAERQRSQLARLVDDLLEVSRITRGRIELRCEPMSVQAAVYAAVESVSAMTEERGQRVSVGLPEHPVRIVADASRVAQMLENLLNNASKFTPVGGRIRVQVEEAPEQVRIEVSDTGAGIEPARLPDVFELFSQIEATLDRAQGGLGIGLALVRRLAELHGGSIEAASPGKGCGATFTLRLPRARSGAPAADAG